MGEPYGEPLCIVFLIGCEQCGHGVVTRDDKAGDVCQKLPAKVEDNQEEVKRAESNDCVCLGNAGLLLQVVDRGIFGELAHEQVSREGLVRQTSKAFDLPRKVSIY